MAVACRSTRGSSHPWDCFSDRPLSYRVSDANISPQWDRCLSSMLIRSGLGVSFGIVFSVLLFKRRAWPAWVGLGFGAGRAWEECDNVSWLHRNCPGKCANTVHSLSSEQQHPQKTVFASSGHKQGNDQDTRDISYTSRFEGERALYSRTWYRSFGTIECCTF